MTKPKSPPKPPAKKRGPGRPPTGQLKASATFSLDVEVLERLRQLSEDDQREASKVANDLLRQAMGLPPSKPRE